MSVHFLHSECVFIGEIFAKNFYPCQEYSTTLDSLTLIRISDICCFMQWNAVAEEFYYVYDYESCFLMLYDPFFSFTDEAIQDIQLKTLLHENNYSAFLLLLLQFPNFSELWRR